MIHFLIIIGNNPSGVYEVIPLNPWGYPLISHGGSQDPPNDFHSMENVIQKGIDRFFYTTLSVSCYSNPVLLGMSD
jgi:hypothetical protein